MDDVKILLENSISSIKLKVMNEVKKLSANDHQVTEIKSIFSDESIVNREHCESLSRLEDTV